MPSRILILSLLVSALGAATYEVGPGLALTTIGAVPWESLAAGDTVLIHWRATPYREKWVINRIGTALAPITVRGVAGPAGQRPVISGENATTRTALSYWSDVRSLIKIGGSSVPADGMPQHIVIENLDLTSARPGYQFTRANGTAAAYTDASSAIYLEKGRHITIRNCVMRDCANGFFSASEDAVASEDVLVTGCSIYGNGIENSIYQHNNYTESAGIVFEYNHFGPLRATCKGSNLKDRSSGCVVRYNWIEEGGRQLDLVESTFASIQGQAAYRSTFVYGNVLIERANADNGNRQIMHYGGDNGDTAFYRKGTLYAYHNTIISSRTDRTTLVNLDTNDEHCDARNNVIYLTATGGNLALLDDAGILVLANNWLKPGFVDGFGTVSGTITRSGNLTGTAPGFIDLAGEDFRLAAGSACIAAAAALLTAESASNPVTREYVKHQLSDPRPSAADIGSCHFRSGDTTAPAISGITIGAIGADTATIGWTTDEGADSQVAYGPTGYGSTTTLAPALVTSHSQVLTGLLPATTYHLQVRSRDASGNLGVSTDQVFTTAAAPSTPPPPTGGGGALTDGGGDGGGGGCGAGAIGIALMIGAMSLRQGRKRRR